MYRSLTRTAGVFLLGAVLLTAGCAAADPVAPPDVATPTASPEARATGCVADPTAVVARTEPLPRTELPADLASALKEASVATFDEIAAPGAIVAVQSPEGEWVHTIGLADPADGRVMSVDDSTRVGSVTKTFTGTLILQLAEQDLLSLDDPISDYVDGVPNGSEINLGMLMTMTSGLASYTLDDEFQQQWFAHPDVAWTPEQLLALAFELAPHFEPGAEFNYSNTNSVLLGEVAEKVTGRSVEELFAEHIFDPLGLTGTVMPVSTDLPDPHAQGFTMQGTAPGATEAQNATNWTPTFAWTAGQLISTVSDLVDYGRALGTGSGLLGEQAQIERLTSFPEGGGYGAAIGCVDGWVGHTGELPGYNTSMFYDTTSDTVVVVLTNSDIPTGSCSTSPMLPGYSATLECMAPATRLFVAVSGVLGHTFTPPPMD